NALFPRRIEVVREQHKVSEEGRLGRIVVGLELRGERQDQRAMILSAIVFGVFFQSRRSHAPDRGWQRSDHQVTRPMKQVGRETDIDRIQETEQAADAQRVEYGNRRCSLDVYIGNSP